MILCIKQSTLTHIKILGRVPGTNSFSALLEDNDDGDSPTEHDYSNSLDLFQPSASNITQGSSGQGVQEELPGILIIRLRDVSLHFANTSALKERLRRLEKYGPERSHPADEPKRSEAVVVVFEMRDVVGIDPGAARVLEEVVRSYGDRDVLVSSRCVFLDQAMRKITDAGGSRFIGFNLRPPFWPF
jgi:MFS superfamily sulfate permease-like transporter